MPLVRYALKASNSTLEHERSPFVALRLLNRLEDDLKPVTIAFTPDPDEIARVQAAVPETRPQKPYSLPSAVAFAAFTIYQGIFNLTGPAHGAPGGFFGYVIIFIGLIYVPSVLRSQSQNRVFVKPSLPIEITIDDAGLIVAEPPTRIPWEQVSKIRDVGEAFVIFRRSAATIPILTRTLPDGGDQLWAALDEKLSGRYLVRGSISRRRSEATLAT